jgi:MFS family permease
MRFGVALGALEERDFRLLFVGQLMSRFGDRLVPIALAFAVLDLTGSAADLGYVLAAATVPMLVFVMVAGVWADRLPRQLVMLVSDLVRAAAQGTTAVLLITGHARIWELAALQAVWGASTAFFTPATTGLIPATVSAARLQQANALMSLSRSMMGILGPVIGGTLVALASPGVALAIDAATFVVSAISLAYLRPAAPRAATRASAPFLRELWEGIGEVRSRTWLWMMILFYGVFNVSAFPAYYVLGPYVAKRSLGGASAWATILTAGAAGALLAGVLALRLRTTRPLLTAQTACLVCALPAVLLGLHAPVLVIAAGSLVSWGAINLADALWHTTLQQRIPANAISRVSAIDWAGTLVLNPVGMAVIGPIAAVVGTRETLLGAGCLTTAAVVATLLVPDVRELRAPEPA